MKGPNLQRGCKIDSEGDLYLGIPEQVYSSSKSIHRNEFRRNFNASIQLCTQYLLLKCIYWTEVHVVVGFFTYS